MGGKSGENAPTSADLGDEVEGKGYDVEVGNCMSSTLFQNCARRFEDIRASNLVSFVSKFVIKQLAKQQNQNSNMAKERIFENRTK